MTLCECQKEDVPVLSQFVKLKKGNVSLNVMAWDKVGHFNVSVDVRLK